MLQCLFGRDLYLGPLRTYFQTCDRKDVPNCLAKDVDRGVSKSSFEDEYLAFSGGPRTA